MSGYALKGVVDNKAFEATPIIVEAVIYPSRNGTTHLVMSLLEFMQMTQY